MDILFYLLPIALFLGGVGLIAFVWALNTGQFDDPDGDSARILFDEPLSDNSRGGKDGSRL